MGRTIRGGGAGIGVLDAGRQGVLFNMPAGSSPDDVTRAGEALAALR